MGATTEASIINISPRAFPQYILTAALAGYREHPFSQ
jgi:hypothetical protein